MCKQKIKKQIKSLNAHNAYYSWFKNKNIDAGLAKPYKFLSYMLKRMSHVIYHHQNIWVDDDILFLC